MRRYALLAVVFVFIQSAAYGEPAKTEIGAGLCSLDDVPVTFESVSGHGSHLILRGTFRMDEETVLSFHFNPFYGIGGQVSLQTNIATTVLLRWANDFSDPISSGSIVHKGHTIECSR